MESELVIGEWVHEHVPPQAELPRVVIEGPVYVTININISFDAELPEYAWTEWLKQTPEGPYSLYPRGTTAPRPARAPASFWNDDFWTMLLILFAFSNPIGWVLLFMMFRQDNNRRNQR